MELISIPRNDVGKADIALLTANLVDRINEGHINA